MLQHTRRATFPALDPYAQRFPVVGRPIIRDKTHAQDEFVGSVDVPIDALEFALRDASWTPNPVSTLKYRDVDVGRQYELGSWRWTASLLADRQWHVYAFASISDDAQLDVYCHVEPNWLRHPRAHQDASRQDDGDVGGRLAAALTKAEIELLD